MNDIHIGYWLFKKRESKGVSQEELAIQIGKSQSCIAKIENETRKLSVSEFIDIVTYLNLSDSEILEIFHIYKNNQKSFWS